VLNNQLYVTNTEEGTLSIVDTSTDTVSWTFSVENGVIYPIIVGTSIYVLNPKSKTFSILTTQLPKLVSFDTDVNDDSYGIGESINVFALFDRKIQEWSMMTIGLNNGPKVVLNTVKDTTLSGKYTIQKWEDKDKLTIASIVSSKIIDFTGREKTDYIIPVNKNLWDISNIVINTAKVVTLPPPTEENLCSAKLYRRCPIVPDPIHVIQYGDNILCEGFISGEVKKNPSISRAEVLEIAVNMMRKELSDDSKYTNTYTDISSEKNANLIPLIQTGLDYKFIYPNGGTFQPTKPVSRIEAYALLMKGICLSPQEWLVGEERKKSLYDMAFSTKLTNKTWKRFRPNKPITRNEVFLVASQLADWADTHGGCDKLECRK